MHWDLATYGPSWSSTASTVSQRDARSIRHINNVAVGICEANIDHYIYHVTYCLHLAAKSQSSPVLDTAAADNSSACTHTTEK
jgi:hypothetical protein